MKKLKLLWLIRNLSKSMSHSHNQSGDELLSILYMEYADTLDIEPNDEPINEEEEMGFHANKKDEQ